ncbi:hypothetical protein [Limosilactobacillus mucosae]|uniref:hypothetical protein n=1 Tax=Limosilactobacillus mucosae TaxID=97478 RepID=UPI0006526B8C|nr:hypothetical protein [Limosilactobacillus mucosae]
MIEMEIYEVMPTMFDGLSHVVVAKNEADAIKLVVDCLNQNQTQLTHHASEFAVNTMEPTIIV